MIARAIFIIAAFLSCGCATTLSSTPQFPELKIEGNRLTDPEYGYSLELPNGWVRVDEAYITRLDVNTRKSTLQALDRLKREGFRAWFIEPSLKAGFQVFANGYPQKSKTEIVSIVRDNLENKVKAENANRGYEAFYNLQFDSFSKLTDFHASYDEADTQLKYVLYLSTYPFSGAEYAVLLAFNGTRTILNDHLPIFYKCINSLSFPGRSPIAPSQQLDGNVQERLQALKQLKEKGLINETDYEKKKREILDDL